MVGYSFGPLMWSAWESHMVLEARAETNKVSESLNGFQLFWELIHDFAGRFWAGAKYCTP